MALTDEQKLKIALHFGLCRWMHPVDGEPYVFWHADRVTAAFDEVESAACAERDARIAELERHLAEARKDAERLDYLQANSRCDPKMDGNHVWWPTSFNVAQSLKGQTIRAAIDNAMQKG